MTVRGLCRPPPRGPRGRTIVPRDRLGALYNRISGLYARKGNRSPVYRARRPSMVGALCGPSHRRTLMSVCPLTSPSRLRRPFIWTKVPCKRERTVLKPSASNEGQVLKGGECSAPADELGLGRPGRGARPCRVHRVSRTGCHD